MVSYLAVLPTALLEEVLSWAPAADIALGFSAASRYGYACQAEPDFWARRLARCPDHAELLEEVPLPRVKVAKFRGSAALRRRGVVMERRASLTLAQRSELDHGLCLAAHDGAPCSPWLQAGASVQRASQALDSSCGATSGTNRLAGGRHVCSTPPLHLAIARGNLAAVRALLDSGADIEVHNENGDSPLVHAVVQRNLEAVQVLIEAGACLEAPDARGETPLICAVVSGHAEMVQALIDGGANVETPDSDGDTPLICAVVNNQAQMVQALLGRRADVEASDREDGASPLSRAVADGQVDIVRALLDGGANLEVCDRSGITLLECAVAEGHVAVVQLMAERGVNIEALDSEDNPLLARSIALGDTKLMATVADGGAVVDAF